MSDEKSRKKIIEKIRKFLAMTVERGAGIEEALTAAKRAAELMQQYDLSIDDIEEKAKATEAEMDVYRFDDTLSRYVFNITSAIEGLCNVKILIGKPGDGVVQIIGLPLDCRFAHYIFEV